MTNSSVGFPQFYQIQQILDRFLDVKTESNYPNTTETQQYRYVAFLIVPANVILTKNFQTGKNIVDITETRSNRLSMGFSLDGKNYDLSHAYAAFTADRTDDSGDVQDVIYNNLPADQAKVFGGWVIFSRREAEFLRTSAPILRP